MSEPTCKDRVREHLKGRVDDLDKLWKLYQNGDEDGDPDLGRFDEYGLYFGYVRPGTFSGQKRGYWQYQLSTGGPGDEFRFYCDENLNPTRIEYWFLDWFGGAKITLRPGSREDNLLREIWEDFKECGAVKWPHDAEED